MALLSRVDIRPDRVEINIRRRRLVQLLHAQSCRLTTHAAKPDNESDGHSDVDGEGTTAARRPRNENASRERR